MANSIGNDYIAPIQADNNQNTINQNNNSSPSIWGTLRDGVVNGVNALAHGSFVPLPSAPVKGVDYDLQDPKLLSTMATPDTSLPTTTANKNPIEVPKAVQLSTIATPPADDSKKQTLKEIIKAKLTTPVEKTIYPINKLPEVLPPNTIDIRPLSIEDDTTPEPIFDDSTSNMLQVLGRALATAQNTGRMVDGFWSKGVDTGLGNVPAIYDQLEKQQKDDNLAREEAKWKKMERIANLQHLDFMDRLSLSNANGKNLQDYYDNKFKQAQLDFNYAQLAQAKNIAEMQAMVALSKPSKSSTKTDSQKQADDAKFENVVALTNAFIQGGGISGVKRGGSSVLTPEFLARNTPSNEASEAIKAKNDMNTIRDANYMRFLRAQVGGKSGVGGNPSDSEVKFAKAIFDFNNKTPEQVYRQISNGISELPDVSMTPTEVKNITEYLYSHPDIDSKDFIKQYLIKKYNLSSEQ